ncbi:uncharacterized protein SPSK_04455 [Sporothrix schenckii 1099-18]|uniref:Uncharacterized protein n=1 Tax=Sporothrix schenckii 1099-18 TaxID=1397361 RepID=A0A0F2M1N6_SPOSC|nr:uncharacterized protein SPSK_04455 [Sporothrix schenckii 1099-18]KJR83618.1 hypothetical protein SPSK_04455 [Sporothrix schenckii 1099-18]
MADNIDTKLDDEIDLFVLTTAPSTTSTAQDSGSLTEASPSQARSTATDTSANIAELASSMQIGDEVLTTIDKIITNLYKAHPSTAAGYAAVQTCGQDLIIVMRSFAVIMQMLPVDEVHKTIGAITKTIVASYHQWAETRIQLSDIAPYERIISMLNVWLLQVVNHIVASSPTLSGWSGERSSVDNMGIVYEAESCLLTVRSHESSRVSQVWAAAIDALLPKFVRLCTEPWFWPGRLGSLVTAYSSYVTAKLAKLKPTIVTKETDMHKPSSDWALFVANRYAKRPANEPATMSVTQLKPATKPKPAAKSTPNVKDDDDDLCLLM